MRPIPPKVSLACLPCTNHPYIRHNGSLLSMTSRKLMRYGWHPREIKNYNHHFFCNLEIFTFWKSIEPYLVRLFATQLFLYSPCRKLRRTVNSNKTTTNRRIFMVFLVLSYHSAVRITLKSIWVFNMNLNNV